MCGKTQVRYPKNKYSRTCWKFRKLISWFFFMSLVIVVKKLQTGSFIQYLREHLNIFQQHLPYFSLAFNGLFQDYKMLRHDPIYFTKFSWVNFFLYFFHTMYMSLLSCATLMYVFDKFEGNLFWRTLFALSNLNLYKKIMCQIIHEKSVIIKNVSW